MYGRYRGYIPLPPDGEYKSKGTTSFTVAGEDPTLQEYIQQMPIRLIWIGVSHSVTYPSLLAVRGNT